MAIDGFEYAPAPESRAIVDIKPSYGLFINGEFVDGARHVVQDHQPRHRGGAGRGRRGRRGRRRPRPSRPPVAPTTRVWRGCPAASGRKYLYRIARIIQERGRELAVLESLDNGKPIKESRDVDVPLVAAHFFYYAGWADKLEYAGFGPTRAARRRRPGHPVELPAADAGVEDRPGAGLRQHRRAQAGRDHAADRAAVRRDLPAGRPAARRRQHHHRRRRHRPRAGRAPRRRQGRLHRLDRRRPGDRPRRRRHAQEGHPRARRQGRQHRLRRRPDRPGHRGHRQRHLLQPGPRLLRRLAAAGAGVASPTRCSTRLKRRMATLRVGDPLDKNTDIGAINSAEQLAKIRELSEIGESEGAERWSPPCDLPCRLLVPPTGVHRRHAGAEDARTRFLRSPWTGCASPVVQMPAARPTACCCPSAARRRRPEVSTTGRPADPSRAIRWACATR